MLPALCLRHRSVGHSTVTLKENLNFMRLSVALFVCITATCALIAATNASHKIDKCDVVTEALDKASEIKAGDSRSVLNRDFEPDGGMQYVSDTRYMFKTCHFIKIDVKFSPIQSQASYSSNDKIEGVSQPYLEYPLKD
jgi:hypothetical protein